MRALATVGEARLTETDLIKYLKLSGKMAPLIDELSVGQIARNWFSGQNLRISTEDLQAACDRYRERLGLHEAAGTRNWLQNMGVAVDDFETHMETQLMVERVRQTVASPEKVAAYFEKHRKELDRFIVSHIVLAEAGRASVIKSDIEEEGLDFGELARAHSLNALTRPMGGFIGPVSRKELEKMLETAVGDPAPGDLIGPLKTGKLYQIIQIDQILPADRLNDELYADISETLFQNWIAEWK